MVETHLWADESAREQEDRAALPSLIAAAFCMSNRYVDGPGARTPDDDPTYTMLGRLLAEGYVR